MTICKGVDDVKEGPQALEIKVTDEMTVAGAYIFAPTNGEVLSVVEMKNLAKSIYRAMHAVMLAEYAADIDRMFDRAYSPGKKLWSLPTMSCWEPSSDERTIAQQAAMIGRLLDANEKLIECLAQFGAHRT